MIYYTTIIREGTNIKAVEITARKKILSFRHVENVKNVEKIAYLEAINLVF